MVMAHHLGTAIRAAGVLCLMMLQGCASSLLRAAESPAATEPPVDFPLTVRTLGADHRFTEIPAAALGARLAAAQLTTQGPARPLEILALSGGGAGGAFGAGALVGLTRAGKRPEFSVVTGVSAGALIAPYAFLGADWDAELTAAYSTGAGAHVLQSRGLGALFGSSAFRGAPLQELVDSHLTDDMLRAVAREARTGRLLLVATTNVDSGEPVVWDLGSIAVHGGKDARQLFSQILVASASVPGIFPPVVIGDEMHVDGGVTLPFFVAPAPAGASVHVLIDGTLGAPVRATRLRTGAILSRSVSAGLSRMLRTDLELTAAEAERAAMSLEYSAIPMAYPYRSAFDFSAAAAGSLFQYAYDCARTGRLWTTFGPEPADSPTAPAETSSSLPAIDVFAHAQVRCPADDAFIERFAVR
jgi:predicted acylesterase/phospholipase RssA